MKPSNTFMPCRSTSKEMTDTVLAYLVKQWIADMRAGTFRTGERHPYFVYQYYKAFNMKNRVRLISPNGKALCLLKTQFAKKPKNPV